MTEQRKLPKSLHTVTVLVNVTHYVQRRDPYTTEAALNRAIQILKLDDLHDVYELRAAALKQVQKS